jgi:hypothetical protein
MYSLRSIIFFANIVVSTHISVIDTSILAKSNIGQREYNSLRHSLAAFPIKKETGIPEKYISRITRD